MLSGEPNPDSNNTLSDLIGNDYVTSLLSIDTAFSLYVDVKPASLQGIYHLIDPTVLEENDYVSKIGFDGSALFNNDNNQVMVDLHAEIQCPIDSKANLGTGGTQWTTLAATGITGATITTTTPAVATLEFSAAQGITAVVGTAVQQTTATGTATGTLTAALTTASTTISVEVTTGTFTTTAALEIGSPPFVATLPSAWTALNSEHCVKMFQLQVTSNQEGVLPLLSDFGLDVKEVILLGHTSLYPWKPKALPNSELIDQDTRIDKAGLYVKALTRVKEGSPLSQLELFPSELWWDGTILKYNTSTHEWERALSLTAAIKKTLKLTEDGTIVLKEFEIYIGETDPKDLARISATIEVILPGSEGPKKKLTFTLAGSITKEYHLSMTGTANGDFQFDHFDKAISGRVKDCTLTVEASLVGATDGSKPFNGLSIEFTGQMTLGDDTIDATLKAHFPQENGQLMISLDILVTKPMVLSDILGPGTDIGSFGIDEGQLNLKIIFGPENAKKQISELDFTNDLAESLSRVTAIYMEQVTLTLNADIKLYGLDGQAKIHMMYNSESDTTSVSAEVGITGNLEELFAALGGGDSATVNKLGETIEEISGGIVYFQPLPSAGKDAKYTLTTLDGFKGKKVKPGLHYMASLIPKTDSSLSAVMKFFDGDKTKKSSGAKIILQGQIMELKLVSACVEETLEGVIPTCPTCCHKDNSDGKDIVGGVINIDGKTYLGHPNDNYWEPDWTVTIDIVLGNRVTLISGGDLKLVVTKASLFVRESGELGANANFELTMDQKLLRMSGDVVLNQKNPNDDAVGRNTVKATLTMDDKMTIDVGEIAISAGDFSLMFAWNYDTDFSQSLNEWNPEFALYASISVGNVVMLGEIKYNFAKGNTQFTAWYDTTTGQSDTVGGALVKAGLVQDTTLVTMKNTPILSGFVKSL